MMVHKFLSKTCKASLALSCTLAAFPLFSNPDTPTVISGTVSFDVSTENLLEVTSESARAIVDWDSFDINQYETTDFILPDSSSAILNRVTGDTASSIWGQITSNGQVFLINENGILLGDGSGINTASFVASTLDVSNSDFLAGNDMLFEGTADDDITMRNFGEVTASSGDIIFMGYQVVNSGDIVADNGVIAMGAGIRMMLQPAEDQRILIDPQSYMQTTGYGIQTTSNIVQAIQLELRADGSAYEFAILHQGTMEATGTSTADGKVFLVANGGVVDISGALVASDNDNTGGYIEIAGTEISIGSGSLLQAIGNSGGGEMFVGGGYQGNDPAIINATTVSVEAGVDIYNYATVNGNGGETIVWADDSMTFYGNIDATAGTQGGDGGLVEISGVQYLDFGGYVDNTAPNGTDGVLLFDPLEMHFHPAAELPVTPQFVQ